MYWNSRLQTEHNRLVSLLSPEDVLADVFAGVGPFALPVAKKGCGVFANDLNPESYKYLTKNIDVNNVSLVSCIQLFSSSPAFRPCQAFMRGWKGFHKIGFHAIARESISSLHWSKT